MRLLQLTLLAALALPCPALAGPQSMAADHCRTIGATLSSAVVDIGMACGNSWPGRAQLLSNIEQFQSPADTEAESSGPFYLGGSLAATATDPVPTGFSGHKGTYLALDGGDFFTSSGQTDASPALVAGFADDWHKTTGGKDFTFVITMTYVDSGAAQTLFSQKASGSNIGVTLFITAGDKVSMTQRGDSAAVTVTSTATLVNGTSYVIAGAHTGNTTTIWIGSSTAESLAHTFNATSAAATAPLTIGATFDATITTPSIFLPSGTKIYDVQIFNAALSDVDMAADIAILEARNGVDFTP